VNFQIAGGQKLEESKIKSLHLINVPFLVVLQYLCETSNTRFIQNGRNVTILPAEE